MLYIHEISSCFEGQIGKYGISQSLYQANLQKAKQQIARLESEKESNRLPLLNIDKVVDLTEVEKIAEKIKARFNNLIIFGIGGSSLGGQTLCGTRFYQYFSNDKINIKFYDNIHYHNFGLLLSEINIQKTAFLVISKSGYTIETLSQTLVTIEHFNSYQNLKEHFFFITENSDNPLRNIAKGLGAQIIDHNKNIGGRYSSFTEVALIPGTLSGVDIDAFMTGGKDIIVDLFQNKENSEIVKGAALIMSIMQKGYSNHVFIPYLQRLYFMVYWYAQLFAESLGKDGKGMTPIKAMGSVDQHSQLQLFLDGPKDKFFTFLTLSTKGLGTEISDKINKFRQIEYLKGNKLGDVMDASQEATIDSLISAGCPVRRFKFEEFNDRALGQVLMHCMLETILLGYALDINPFDQPSVEGGKVKARETLKKSI